jgi:hypothetical protein
VRFPFAEYTIFLRLKKGPLAKTPLLIEPTQPQIHRPSEFLNLKAFGSCAGSRNSGTSIPEISGTACARRQDRFQDWSNEPVEAVSLSK